MKYLLVFILKFYKSFVSPALFGVFGRACKFTPTCGEYAIRVVEKKGAVKGGWLAIRRLSLCR